LALLEDFMGPDYKASVEDVTWEPGSLSGRGLKFEATTPGPAIRRLRFQTFSVGATASGLEFDGAVDGGVVQGKMEEDLVHRTIAVSVTSSEMTTPADVEVVLAGYGLSGRLSMDISLALVPKSAPTSEPISWRRGDIELAVISSGSLLSVVPPAPGPPINLGAPALRVSWDASTRQVQMRGGFQGETRNTSLTAVSATYSSIEGAYLLEGRIDRDSPPASFLLSGNIDAPTFTAADASNAN